MCVQWLCNVHAVYLTVKKEQCGQENEDGQNWVGEEYPVDELSMRETIL